MTAADPADPADPAASADHGAGSYVPPTSRPVPQASIDDERIDDERIDDGSEQATFVDPPWRVSDSIIGWLLAFVVSAMTAVATAGMLGEDLDDPGFGVFATSSLAMWTTTILWCRFVSRRRGTGRVLHDLRVRFNGPRDVIGGALLGIASSIVIGLLIHAVYDLIEPTMLDRVGDDTQELANTARGPLFIVFAVFVVVGAPLIEELFFRGLLLRALAARMPGAAAVAVSSVLFGLAHLQLHELPGLILIGAVLGTMVWRTGRLGPAIAAHAGFNALAVVSLIGQTS